MRSSSILGGSQVLIFLFIVLRNKAAALLLGPSGIGALSLYQSIITMVGTISSMGIGNSGVREIAEASGKGDDSQVRKNSEILHRLSLFTGVLGWLLAAGFSYPISRIAFGSSGHEAAITLLGSCLLFGAVGTSYSAILQGTRRMGALAKLQVTSNIFSAVLSVIIYASFGVRGIVPSIIAGAALSCGMAWWMQKKTIDEYNPVSWRETLLGSQKMIVMGFAFMWNAVLTGAVAFGIRALVVREDGLESAGIYQAGWAISGMFAGFILQAMGTDFYPRLTASASDSDEMNRLVNEQTEIGILLAGPGVLLTLCLAPFLMEWLYSTKFISGTPLICWFAIGVFGQVISWPLGFIQIARGASRAFIITQSLFNSLHFGLIAVLYPLFGVLGVGISFVALYVIYTLSMLAYAKRTTGFIWSPSVRRLIVMNGVLISIGFLIAFFASGLSYTLLGFLLAVFGGLFCARELARRLPETHRYWKILIKITTLVNFRKKF